MLYSSSQAILKLSQSTKGDFMTLIWTGVHIITGNPRAHFSRKSRKRFGTEKTFVTLRPVYSVKLVFSYVVKAIKIITTAKFRAPRRLRFKDTKRIKSPGIRMKSFGVFEKQASGHTTRVLLFCSYHILMSPVINRCTDPQQHEIYSLIANDFHHQSII